MEKVRWGILSTAKIGVEKVIPAMLRAEHCNVVAIASRSIEMARAAASTLGINQAHGSYDELLADPEGHFQQRPFATFPRNAVIAR